MSKKLFEYKVIKQFKPVRIDADWNKPEWDSIEPLMISNHMGDKPLHSPNVLAKLAWDENAIYVIFKVKDQYVVSVAEKHHDPVYKDSCVEFFFTPCSDITKGYFNLEMNCGGTMLFHYKPLTDSDTIIIPVEECGEIEVAHSIPKIIYPEISTPITWIVEYRIPLTLLKKYCDITAPNLQAVWRGNFYKCADDSSHPHWLTWSPVDFPKPNFHLPQYFGRLIFCKNKNNNLP